MTEIQEKIRELITQHEEQLKLHSPNSNAGSFHRGQIRKLSQARQFIKDAIMAEECYNETPA